MYLSAVEPDNGYLQFVSKNQYKSVSEYANAVGVNDFDTQWKQFKLKFDRKYSSEEEEKRKFNFLKSIQYIESHNNFFAKEDISYEVDINQFADRTPEEYNSMRGTRKGPLNMNQSLVILEIDPTLYTSLPSSFDWRDQGKVTPVKDQGQCGSCWAFACIATIESAYMIKHNQSVSLSEQHLLDCSSPDNTCDGGYVYKAYEYAVDVGVEQNSDYPYLMRRQSCRNDPSRNHIKLSGYKRLPYLASDDMIKSAIISHGPLLVSICASGNDFKFYRSGIITGGPTEIDHAVSVFGWGPGYWIIKNSWTTSWGENGFGRIATGRNVRSFNEELYFPIL